VFRYSKKENTRSSEQAAPKLQRQAISATPKDGENNISRKPSRVGERDLISIALSQERRQSNECRFDRHELLHWLHLLATAVNGHAS
jgi:hypothetical protein